MMPKQSLKKQRCKVLLFLCFPDKLGPKHHRGFIDTAFNFSRIIGKFDVFYNVLRLITSEELRTFKSFITLTESPSLRIFPLLSLTSMKMILVKVQKATGT